MREHTVKKLLFPVLVITVLYVLLGFGISLHSIFDYATIGSFDATTFGETPKIRLLSGWLSALGITSDAILCGTIILMRDTLNSVREIVFAFGLVVWIAFLSRKDFLGTFKTVRKTVLWGMTLLIPYIACEVLHLFGMGATDVLKAINSILYDPCSFLGWYPPLVSPNQVRGTWTEPAYFAIWLAFAVPFLVSYFFKDGLLSLKRAVIAVVFFSTLFSIWFMTYARTSVVLMTILVGLYLFFAVLFRTRENLEKSALLLVTLFLGFFIISMWGPQNASVLLDDTIKSSVDAKSRSNPTKLQVFYLKFQVFEDNPFFGAGDTLASVAQICKMKEIPDQLTGESRQRMAYTHAKGIFQSGVNGSSLSVSGVLACRGLSGFTAIFVPIFLLGLSLFVRLFKVREKSREIGITLFVSCSGAFVAVFSQGLWYFYFWASAGLALAFLLQIPKEPCSKKI